MAWRGAGCLLLFLSLGACGEGEDGAPRFTIACAASLRRVVPDLLDAYAATSPGARFQPTYGASGTLRRQVQAGAPVCGVLLASDLDVDRLLAAGRIEGATRTVVARNVLVLIGAADAPATTFRELVDLAADARIAIADPRTAPAGRYARSALEGLGAWDALQDRLLPAADVAGVTAYVRRGEVRVGIAYATEVVHLPAVRVLDRAEGDWAPVAVVMGGACPGAAGAEAFRAFLTFLLSDPARAVWTRHGFLPP